MFHIVALNLAKFVGNAWVFICMLLAVVIWFACGPFFQYSDTWQLVINTSTSVITFLIVFIIQNTQNRDTIALNIKLDELIRVHKLAHNTLIDLDKLSEEQIKELETHYCQLSQSESSESSESIEESNGNKSKID
ncbi:MAG: low affinity iron permease family protein [Proteobacteria bacterium]|nr:low affinity iron permease family protein [Pseudomonadota bacterium]